ncbi:MAG: TIGR00730 family Rossman fold protein [Ignavibacteriales bacterium]|nr:TIGR00730 family Rossman fold protein [Ignavibacteriales bacterium]
MKSLAIFCGSSSGTNGAYNESAVVIGKMLAERNIAVVYGGGSFGLMGVVASSAMDNGGKVIGVIPTILVKKEAAKKDITELIVVDSMQERKAKIMEISDGFLTLPGGLGTMDELFEMMAFVNLGVHNKPCGVLNTNGFYDHLIRFVDHATESGFIRHQTRKYMVHDEDPVQLLKKMMTI